MPYIKKVELPTGSQYDVRDVESLHYAGTLGSGGTILVLPAANQSNKGDVYNVITDGTYDSQPAKVNDLFVSVGTKWILIKVTDTNTTYTIESGDSNGQIKVTPSDSSAFNVAVTGLDTAAYKKWISGVVENSGDLVTSGAVYSAIASLPQPMVYRGTVGVGGDVENVPMDGTATIGDTYKVITDGSYGGYSDCKMGDVLTCVTKTSVSNTWDLIPAGDSDTDTWRSIKVNDVIVMGSGISSGAVNYANGTHTTVAYSNGTITISVPNLATTTIGSASAGSAISADSINSWTANTPTAVTLPTYTVSNETLVITGGAVTNGTAAQLSHTPKSIPNISVNNVTVVTGYDE